MSCYQQAVDDFRLQIQMVEMELSMMYQGDELPAYLESKVDELESKKLKLMSGMRYNQNARNAYWYVTARGNK
jgi:hypothetical protein